MDTDEETGDHGLDDAIELLETLLFDGVFMLGTGGTSSSERPNTEGRRDLIVCARSSSATRVELFHAGR